MASMTMQKALAGSSLAAGRSCARPSARVSLRARSNRADLMLNRDIVFSFGDPTDLTPCSVALAVERGRQGCRQPVVRRRQAAVLGYATLRVQSRTSCPASSLWPLVHPFGVGRDTLARACLRLLTF